MFRKGTFKGMFSRFDDKGIPTHSQVPLDNGKEPVESQVRTLLEYHHLNQTKLWLRHYHPMYVVNVSCRLFKHTLSSLTGQLD